MKNYFCIIVFAILFVFLGSCNNDPLDRDNSIFDTTPPVRTTFDNWLLENYVKNYNIDLKYRFEDIESDYTFNLTPAEESKAIVLSQIIKHVWLEAYDEVAGVDFLRTYVPRVIHFIGSGGHIEGQVTLGTAEGGMKITLYVVNQINVNNIDPAALTDSYFHTMHHEFAHILHQTKNYDPGFKLISASEYRTGDWRSTSLSTALSLGFISPYASSEPNEDFVELYAFYVTNTQQWWDNRLNSTIPAGRNIINQKLEIVRDYFNDVWGIDLDDLREVVLRRGAELTSMEFLTFKE